MIWHDVILYKNKVFVKHVWPFLGSQSTKWADFDSSHTNFSRRIDPRSPDGPKIGPGKTYLYHEIGGGTVVGRQDICCVCRQEICCVCRQEICCVYRQEICGLPRHPNGMDDTGGPPSAAPPVWSIELACVGMVLACLRPIASSRIIRNEHN